MQLVCTNGLYGAERWILALARNLVGRDIVCDLAVTVESAAQDLQIIDHYPAAAGEVLRLPMTGAFDPRVVVALARLLRERRVDIVHTHGYKSYLIGLSAARLAGVATVATPHGFGFVRDIRSRLYTAAGNLALRRHHAVAPLSEELYRDVLRYGVSESRTTLIQNGVDLDEVQAVRDAGTRTANLPAGRRVGYIGQLIARKRIDLMIDAFDLLWRSASDTHLVLVGDGAERAVLEARANALEGRANVHFLGFREDRLDVLAQLDAFVMTSESEGIPRCLMEAMGMGVPIVAFGTAGVDALVHDGVTGALVAHGDVQAMAGRLRAVLEDPALSQRLRAAAAQRVEREFSARRMADDYERLFREVVRIGQDPSSL